MTETLNETPMPVGRKLIFDDDPSQAPAWETALPPLPVEKPWIQLPGEGRLVSAFAQDLGGQLAPHGLYRWSERVLAEDRAANQSTLLDAPRLVTFVEDFVQCTKHPAPAEGEEDKRVVTSMRLGDAKLVLAADRFRNQLQAVEHVNPIRLPVLAPATGLRLLPEGVDDKTRILTERRSLPYRLDLPIDEARSLLDGLLGEFPFADAAYAKAVQLAAMLTVYGLDLLSPRASNAWESKPIAISDRGVSGKAKLWQHSLVLLADRDSERARLWSGSEAGLPTGKYLLKVHVDVAGRLKSDWNATLGEAELIGEAVVESGWPKGYGKMTVVEAGRLRR